MVGSNPSTITYPSTGVGLSGSGGSYTYTTNNTASSPWIIASSNGAGVSSSLHVKGDAEFEGNVTVKGRDLVKLLETIEDRLAIVSNPDPKKLEKFKALKKAYDHYKLMEKLIGEEE